MAEYASQSRASGPILSERRSFRLGYWPALDGFRGVSILAVMLYHTGLLTGGFLGIDMFFVLSGFLITSLLLDELASTGRVSFRAFYVRRALRLLPALTPVVVIVGGAMIVWDPNLGAAGFVLPVIFSTANWPIVYGLPEGLLGHVWSLAIAAQFYAIWPPLLLLLVRIVRRRWALWLIVAAALGLAMARTYVGLAAHADPLLVGCALGILCVSQLFRRTRRAVIVWNVLGVLAGLALLGLIAQAHFPVESVLASASTWAAVASAFVIVAALLPSSPCGDLLGWAPLTWLGRHSYALYLWHYPLFYAAGPLWKPEAHPTAALLAWLVTFALAAASFHYIEQPVLNLKATLAARRADAAAWPDPTSTPLAAPARPGRS